MTRFVSPGRRGDRLFGKRCVCAFCHKGGEAGPLCAIASEDSRLSVYVHQRCVLEARGEALANGGQRVVEAG